MRISEYIKHLQKIQQQHGDLEVDTYVGSNRVSARRPEIGHRKILIGREKRADFWGIYDGPDRKGEKVVVL